MGSGRLTDRVQAVDGGTPPRVDVDTTIVVLGAHPDLQTLRGQVDPWTAVQVELVDGEIHVTQPLDGARQVKDSGRFQIAASLIVETMRVPPRLVDAKVKEHPAPPHHRLPVCENVDKT